MATVDDPDTVVQRLHVIMRDGNDPDDQGMLVDMGRELLRVYNACAAYTRRTGGKAFKGTATVVFEFHSHKSETETEVDITMRPITSKQPPLTMPRKKRTFAGHDGEISTVPIQEELPITGIKGSVNGGKQDAPKGAVKAI